MGGDSFSLLIDRTYLLGLGVRSNFIDPTLG